tara:strand:+ start:1445 stop:1933 length:489 start_codon:yes stop_codon:yes gene_type:complete
MGKEKNTNIPCFATKLIHYADFDIYDLLKTAPTFFKKYQYDFWEKAHAEKPDGVGYTVESEWNASRDINDYVRFKINIKFWIRGMTKVVYDNGVSTYRGKVTIFISASMDKNYAGSFGPERSQEFMRQIYERFVRRPELLNYEDKLADECVDFVTSMKAELK